MREPKFTSLVAFIILPHNFLSFDNLILIIFVFFDNYYMALSHKDWEPPNSEI